MGISNLGGIIGAFAGSKMERMNKNQGLQDQIDSSTSGMDKYRQEADTIPTRSSIHTYLGSIETIIIFKIK